MNLFLIRHGQSTGNVAGRFQGWSNLPLTDEGRRPGRAHRRVPGSIYPGRKAYLLPPSIAATLDRALHTAEAIGRHLGLTPIHDSGLARDELRGH